MKRKFAILLSAMLLTQAVCGCGAAERVRPEEGRMALRIDVIKK